MSCWGAVPGCCSPPVADSVPSTRPSSARSAMEMTSLPSDPGDLRELAKAADVHVELTRHDVLPAGPVFARPACIHEGGLRYAWLFDIIFE